MKAKERTLTNLLGSGNKLYILLSDESTQTEFIYRNLKGEKRN